MVCDGGTHQRTHSGAGAGDDAAVAQHPADGGHHQRVAAVGYEGVQHSRTVAADEEDARLLADQFGHVRIVDVAAGARHGDVGGVDAVDAPEDVDEGVAFALRILIGRRHHSDFRSSPAALGRFFVGR